MLLGVLLVVLGPLLLIPVTWLLYRFAVRRTTVSLLVPKISETVARRLAVAVSAVIVAGILVLSYLPGKWEFERLCSQHATPVVSERVRADGFYRTRMFSYEARAFLGEDSFTFVEAPNMYKEGVHMSYSLAADGSVSEQEVTALNSVYGVRKDFSELAYGITMTRKLVYEIETARELAKAAQINYRGGPLSIFLSVYGMSSCPDIFSEEGSRQFRTFYDLETITLRAPPLQ